MAGRGQAERRRGWQVAEGGAWRRVVVPATTFAAWQLCCYYHELLPSSYELVADYGSIKLVVQTAGTS